MIKLKILSVGKTKEKWLDDACEEYLKRLKPFIQVELAWAKDTPHLIEWVKKEPSYIGLDPAGQLLDSPGFAQFMVSQWEKAGSRLALVIGGAEGLPAELKQASLISLSPLTFTHQITRLVLIEQIYRAVEISKGSHYHK